MVAPLVVALRDAPDHSISRALRTSTGRIAANFPVTGAVTVGERSAATTACERTHKGGRHEWEAPGAGRAGAVARSGRGDRRGRRRRHPARGRGPERPAAAQPAGDPGRADPGGG